MSIYLSIDVATKSLAMGLYEVNLKSIPKEIPNDESGLDRIIQVIHLEVINLTEHLSAKKISIHEKAIALKKALTRFDTFIPEGASYQVIIEYQMNANHMSNAIFNMIAYHYADVAPVHTVYPSLKNTIYLHPKLKLSDFMANATNNYLANKNHSKWNFLYFMLLFEYKEKLKYIKPSNYDDIADTFMQCLAFVRLNKCS